MLIRIILMIYRLLPLLKLPLHFFICVSRLLLFLALVLLLLLSTSISGAHLARIHVLQVLFSQSITLSLCFESLICLLHLLESYLVTRLGHIWVVFPRKTKIYLLQRLFALHVLILCLLFPEQLLRVMK